MSSTTTMLVAEILAGEHDGDFDAIRAAIQTRERMLRPAKANSFCIGDEVRFNSHARPKYLVGVKGVVKKVNPSSVVVSIGADGGRFANSEPRAPIEIVDKVEA